MGRSAVLANVVDYLKTGAQTGNGAISFLGDVFGHFPKFLAEQSLFEGQVAGAPSGAFIWAWLGSRKEKRISLQGPPAGGKMRYYDLRLQCVMVSAQSTAESAGADNDTFLDTLHDYIVASKVAGGGGAVWQWAEGATSFGFDYVETVGDPQLNKDRGVIHIYTAISIVVLEEA